MRQWRALHGAERDVYFAQVHPSGRLGLSDFTTGDELCVEIGGAAFTHRLYQLALAHSGWRHVQVVVGGESFIALSTRLRAALWRLGGVPEEHRTDSLSAASNTLAEQETLSLRHDELCRHYGMRASRCNPVTFAVHLHPDLICAIDLHVGVPHAFDLRHQLSIPLRTGADT